MRERGKQEEEDKTDRWVPGRSEGESGAGRGAKQAAVGRCAVERAEPVSSDLIRWIEIRRIRSNRYAI